MANLIRYHYGEPVASAYLSGNAGNDVTGTPVSEAAELLLRIERGENSPAKWSLRHGCAPYLSPSIRKALSDDPRIFFVATHLLPFPVFEPQEKVIHVVRHPAATLWSYWNFLAASNPDNPMSIENVIRGGTFVGPWAVYTEAWLSAGAVLGESYRRLRYEDLLLSALGLFDTVSAFAPISPVARDGFPNFDEWRRLDPHQYRSGEPDEWLDRLSPRQLALIERIHGLTMRRLGYALPISPSLEGTAVHGAAEDEVVDSGGSPSAKLLASHPSHEWKGGPAEDRGVALAVAHVHLEAKQKAIEWLQLEVNRKQAGIEWLQSELEAKQRALAYLEDELRRRSAGWLTSLGLRLGRAFRRGLARFLRTLREARRALRVRRQAFPDVSEALKRYSFYHVIPLTDEIATPGVQKFVPIQEPVLETLRGMALKGARVLDVGCRDGLFSFEAERLGAAEVIGIDNNLSPAATEFLIPYFRSRVRMHEANLYDLRPRTFGLFDVVICAGVLYHLRFPFWGLRTLRELLEPNGRLLLETAIWRGGEGMASLWIPVGTESPYEPSSVSFFNEKGLLDTMKSLGFEVETSQFLPEDSGCIVPTRWGAVTRGTFVCRRLPAGSEGFLRNYWEGRHDEYTRRDADR